MWTVCLGAITGRGWEERHGSHHTLCMLTVHTKAERKKFLLWTRTIPSFLHDKDYCSWNTGAEGRMVTPLSFIPALPILTKSLRGSHEWTQMIPGTVVFDGPMPHAVTLSNMRWEKEGERKDGLLLWKHLSSQTTATHIEALLQGRGKHHSLVGSRE